MKILLTGSHGFIAQHIARLFLANKWQVYGLEREKLNNIEFIYHDIADIKPDFIIHTAAYGNHSTQTEPTRIVATNILKTHFLLEATKRLNFSGLILFGSSSEYGNKKRPMKETDLPETNTFYGATKVASTYLGQAYAKAYDKPIVTVRPFSVYGPGEADFRFIPTACRSIVTGELMAVDPWPSHDWIFIDDFVTGILTVMSNAHKLKGEVVNIGTGIQYTNEKVLSLLEKVSGRQVHHDAISESWISRPYDTKYWVANNKKLRDMGWSPAVDLDAGLYETYAYYKEKYDKQGLKKKDN